MKFTAVFHYGRPSVALALKSIRVAGDFADVAEARQVAIDTATKNCFFAEWCVGFDLEDAEGNILSQWDKNDRRKA